MNLLLIHRAEFNHLPLAAVPLSGCSTTPLLQGMALGDSDGYGRSCSSVFYMQVLSYRYFQESQSFAEGDIIINGFQVQFNGFLIVDICYIYRYKSIALVTQCLLLRALMGKEFS